MSNVETKSSNECQSLNFEDILFSSRNSCASLSLIHLRFITSCEPCHLELSLRKLPSQPFLKLLGQHGNNGEEVADNPVGGNLKNGRFPIFVDGYNNIRCLHASLVLN